MRFHSDPCYGCWTDEAAVVSIGQTRRFTFREASDFSSRWEYAVSNGDVVYMTDDCQQRLQHSVKVERDREDRRAAEMGPRMSLVFKQRAKDSTGRYLDG
jgi:alkylated DNA repair dioxygenase AlkB